MDRRSALASLAAAAASAAAVAAGGSAADAQKPEAVRMASESRPSFIETRDGGGLFYNDWGNGKPVLFSHAWGLNADIWEYQLTELADRGLRCIAYDRRGHGRSTDPGRGYDYDTLADDLAALIDRLDLHDVTLVGHSMGNGEAVRYLSRHGSSRIARLLMVGTVSPQADNTLLDSFIAGLKKDRPAFFASSVAAFTGGHSAISPAMIEWVIAQFMRASPKATLECARTALGGDLRADMQAITVPTLLIHGDKDQISPLERTARKAAAIIKGCELRVYEDAPHGVVLTHRERLTQDILAFARA